MTEVDLSEHYSANLFRMCCRFIKIKYENLIFIYSVSGYHGFVVYVLSANQLLIHSSFFLINMSPNKDYRP